MSNLLSHLNPAQQEAVTHERGPALVLAGAGSGKTTVLTAHALWLARERAVDPRQILLITFTNKAAGEMRQRLVAQKLSELPTVTTFHSFCARFLRRHAAELNLDQHYSIYDGDDQLSALKIIIKEKGLDPRQVQARAVQSLISRAKNELLTPAKYQAIAQGPWQHLVAELYEAYQRKLRQASALDFDDLLLFALRLLQNSPTVRAQAQSQYQHVLVDEYQDTNQAQYQISKLLAAPEDNLFVVGDFSQSIYAWRGADYRNMLQLSQHYPNRREYRLEQNYRSTESILEAASQVIAKNRSHPILKLWTTKEKNEPLTILEASTDLDEAKQVVAQIQYYASKYPLDQIAILYRTNAQSRVFEEQLLKVGLPYTIVGGTKFYERKEIKDVLSHLRLLNNPLDSISLARLLKLGKRRLEQFLNWLKEKRAELLTRPPLQILEEILTVTAYAERFDPQQPEDLSRLENLEELGRVANQFSTLTDFLENIALIQDGYLLKTAEKTTAPASVQLMSLHAAKGLEFELVFLVGVEEGLLPHGRALQETSELEEERRLCYVGITRAKEKLFLSYAGARFHYGEMTPSIPSRFLADLPRQHLEKVGGAKLSQATVGDLSQFDQELIEAVLAGEVDAGALVE